MAKNTCFQHLKFSHFALPLATCVLLAGPITVTHAAEQGVLRAAIPPLLINHVIVIELENEEEGSAFGTAASLAPYLNTTLKPKGELLVNYYGTSHTSLGNYIAQISGQGTNILTNDECISNIVLSPPSTSTPFLNVEPGTDDPNISFHGQVDGIGCVYPAPTATTHGAQTIGNQLTSLFPSAENQPVLLQILSNIFTNWRVYEEDMGNDISRDSGTPDALGIGTDCAHPAIGATDNTLINLLNGGATDFSGATPTDAYTDRHNPFIYFHSVIDNQAYCNQHVVPLGTIKQGTNGKPDTFMGRLAEDLKYNVTTPRFSFIVPNTCNDGHDNPSCVGTNLNGTKTGGLSAADLWLQHWMPLILNSPAYKNGSTLVVITFDEGNAATDTTSCCGEISGPNLTIPPGFLPSLPNGSNLPGLSAVEEELLSLQKLAQPAPGTGGGQIGALLLNPFFIKAGSVNTTPYNHFSALRSYEDLLGIVFGGDDGLGHLGFAAMPGLIPFGPDVFNGCQYNQSGFPLLLTCGKQ